MWARLPKAVVAPQAAPARRAQFVFWYAANTPIRHTTPHTAAISSRCCQLFEEAVDSLLWQQREFVERALTAPSFEINCRLRRPQDIHEHALEALTVGLRVTDLASSTARFELALFCADDDKPVASGHVVRIFIDPHSNQPAQLGDALTSYLDSFNR